MAKPTVKIKNNMDSMHLYQDFDFLDKQFNKKILNINVYNNA